MMTVEAAIIFAVLSVVVAPSPFNEDYDQAWEQFKVKFQKKYDATEEGARRLIFEKSARKVAKHNLEADLGIHDYTLGFNHFSDQTPEEQQKTMGCFIHVSKRQNTTKWFIPPTDFELPKFVDWREKGYVTPVKDQKQCGSCWAFSTTGSLEGQHKAKTGKLVSLSEQNLVDCSKNGNEGCDGGEPDQAFEYVKKNKGIDTEDSYPYEGTDDRCRFKRSFVGAKCSGYVDIPEGNETALQAAVATVGPISVAIDASSEKFQMYSGGIYNDHSCTTTDLDHAVLVVGYGSKKDKDYWIVKNSWGTNWGMEGYILMSRNKDNQCGIASQASYPLM